MGAMRCSYNGPHQPEWTEMTAGSGRKPIECHATITQSGRLDDCGRFTPIFAPCEADGLGEVNASAPRKSQHATTPESDKDIKLLAVQASVWRVGFMGNMPI